MSNVYLLTLVCPDRPGLISAVTAELFDLGINLGDANFAILGTGAELSAVLEAPAELSADTIRQHLALLPELQQADIQVRSFAFSTLRADSGTVTHYVMLEGDDQPGLVARLTELLSDYDSNIVRMDTRVRRSGDKSVYLIDLSASIPATRAGACIAAINNTAATLGMSCQVEEAAD